MCWGGCVPLWLSCRTFGKAEIQLCTSSRYSRKTSQDFSLNASMRVTSKVWSSSMSPMPYSHVVKGVLQLDASKSVNSIKRFWPAAHNLHQAFKHLRFATDLSRSLRPRLPMELSQQKS